MTVLSDSTRSQVAVAARGLQDKIAEQTKAFGEAIAEQRQLQEDYRKRQATRTKKESQILRRNVAAAKVGLRNLFALASDKALVEMARLNGINLKLRNYPDPGLKFYWVMLKHGGVFVSFKDDALEIDAGDGVDPKSVIYRIFLHRNKLHSTDGYEELFRALSCALDGEIDTAAALTSSPGELNWDSRMLLFRFLIDCAYPGRLQHFLEHFLVNTSKS